MLRMPLAAVALVTLALGASCHAQEASLRVALFDVAPYAWEEQGRIEGHYVRLVHEMFDSAGIAVQIQLQPFARIPLSLRDGRADLTLAFPTSNLREAAMEIGPVMHVDSVVIMSRTRRASRVTDLKGASIGRARGGCLDLTERTDLELRWTEVSSFESALRMLQADRLEALCLTRDVLRYYVQKEGIDRARLGNEIVVGQRTVMLFARRDLPAAWVARLRSALSRWPRRRGDSG